MYGYNLRETAVIGATIVASIACFCALLIVLCVRISANDRADIERDRAVKVACIENGKSLIGGSCVLVAVQP